MTDYHEFIRNFPTDVLELSFPRLRLAKDYNHPAPCSDAGCRLCAPLSTPTTIKVRHYAKLMYRLVTENEITDEHIEHFKSNAWLLDYELALEAVDAPQREGGTVKAREKKQRLQVLAQLCDAVHTDEFLEMAAAYRKAVDDMPADEPAAPPETKAEAEADLQRIRAALRAAWEAMDGTLEPARMDALLYCATVFGMGADDTFAPIRTDWWRASYVPDREVPGIGKPGNLIDISADEVWLRVPSCTKEPHNSCEINVTQDSPLLADILRAYKPVALERNDGFLFRPCGMPARKSRRPRAMMKLLRPPGPCPHEDQCTRCHESFRCGKNGRRLCACTEAGKRARPECGSYCGPGCGHFTNIAGRHKRVCAALGNVQEREQLAASMGTTKAQMERYGNGSGSVGA
jgi:hypothetical protein